MDMYFATEIVMNACRNIGGREPVDLSDDLESLGIASSSQVDRLIQLIVEAGAQLGYKLNPTDLAQITAKNRLFEVMHIVSAAPALSPPKTCSLGHPVGAGQSTCAYGHPAQ